MIELASTAMVFHHGNKMELGLPYYLNSLTFSCSTSKIHKGSPPLYHCTSLIPSGDVQTALLLSHSDIFMNLHIN